MSDSQGDIPGRQRPRAKPLTLTFYDTLRDYPYTTTFMCAMRRLTLRLTS